MQPVNHGRRKHDIWPRPAAACADIGLVEVAAGTGKLTFGRRAVCCATAIALLDEMLECWV